MVAMKGTIDHTTPLFMAGTRLVPAGILILVAAMLWGRFSPGETVPKQPQGIRAWLWISLFALVDGTMFQGFLAEGLQRTGAGLGSVMIDSQPIAIALMSAWLFKEVIGVWGWLGLSLGVMGISLIGLPPELWAGIFHGSRSLTFSWQGLFNNGELLMLLASLSMAVGTILMPYVSKNTNAVMATGWHMILGGLPLFALSGIYETDQWTNLQWSDSFALGYSTIFGSAIAYGLFFYFASKGNLTSLSSLTFLTPVFALLFSSFLLEEVLSPLQWTGVSLTIMSIYLINQREKIGGSLSQIFRTSLETVPVLGESELAILESNLVKVIETSLEMTNPTTDA